MQSAVVQKGVFKINFDTWKFNKTRRGCDLNFKFKMFLFLMFWVMVHILVVIFILRRKIEIIFKFFAPYWVWSRNKKKNIKINQFIFIEGNVNNVYVHRNPFYEMKNWYDFKVKTWLKPQRTNSMPILSNKHIIFLEKYIFCIDLYPFYMVENVFFLEEYLGKAYLKGWRDDNIIYNKTINFFSIVKNLRFCK